MAQPPATKQTLKGVLGGTAAHMLLQAASLPAQNNASPASHAPLPATGTPHSLDTDMDTTEDNEAHLPQDMAGKVKEWKIDMQQNPPEIPDVDSNGVPVTVDSSTADPRC